MKKRIFITGGAGFIGANLVEYLIQKGCHNIKIYDNLSVGKKEYIEEVLSKFGIFKKRIYKKKITYHISHNQYPITLVLIIANILDSNALLHETKDYDAIIHLAAHTRVIESLKNPRENFTVNSIGTFNLLEAARKNKVKKFIFASSNAAVGEQIPPINEKMIPNPLSPYGASKLYGEALCAAYYHSYGLRTVALRFANAYGPYSVHKTSVVAKFIRRVKQKKALEIYGDGQQTRDFIHAQDVCQAIYLSLTPYSISHTPDKVIRGGIYSEIFQIATGKEIKIIDLANVIRDLFNMRKTDIKFSSKRKGEIVKNYSDISKSRKLLDFKPNIKLKEGIKALINQQ